MIRALGTAAFGGVLVLSAAAFDTPSLYVPGLALAALAAAAAGWVWLAAAGAGVERTVGPPRVQEEEPYPLRVAARTGAAPAPGGELVEPLLDRSFGMAGRRERRFGVQVRFARRGPRTLEPARLRLRDPLGLVERELVSSEAELLVLPRIEPVLVGGVGGQEAASLALLAGARPGTPAAELELDSLRPHRPGAPASRIHWPTVARTRTMMERRFLPDADSRPLVVLDPRGPASEEALDQAVRAAASLTVALAGRGGCGLLLPGDGRPTDVEADLRAWPDLHARLALVRAFEGPLGIALRGRRAAVFWVQASAGRTAPPALARALTGARWLVGPEPLRDRAVSFTVAGCSGQRLGRQASRTAA